MARLSSNPEAPVTESAPNRRAVLKGAAGAVILASLSRGFSGRLAVAGEAGEEKEEKSVLDRGQEEEREFLRVPLLFNGADPYDADFTFKVSEEGATREASLSLIIAREQILQNLINILGKEEAHRIAPALVSARTKYPRKPRNPYNLNGSFIRGINIRGGHSEGGENSAELRDLYPLEVLRFGEAYGSEAIAALYRGDEAAVRRLFKSMPVPGYFAPKSKKKWPTESQLEKMDEEDFWSEVRLEWPEQRVDFLLNLCREDVYGDNWISGSGKYSELSWYGDTDEERALLREFITKHLRFLGVPD